MAIPSYSNSPLAQNIVKKINNVVANTYKPIVKPTIKPAVKTIKKTVVEPGPNMTYNNMSYNQPSGNMTYNTPDGLAPFSKYTGTTVAPTSGMTYNNMSYNQPSGNMTYNTPDGLNDQGNNEAPKIKTLSSQEAVELAQSYGLGKLPGFNANEYTGRTAEEANQMAEAKRDELLAQTSDSTSYSFNTDSIANSKKTADKFKVSIDGITQDPWKYNSKPDENKKSIVDSFTSQFANNFTNAQDFYNNLNNNPELQKSLEGYMKAGGTPAMIASKIVPVTNDILPAQDTATYLDRIQNTNTPQGVQAKNALIQEKGLAEEEIMRNYSIPKDLSNLYFGTKETIGVLEQQRTLAAEKKRIVEEKQLSAEKSNREQAQYEIEKNNADVESAQAETELNRQNAKNYMTGMLAKLGALQTTGAAPLALAPLEQKYQKQKTDLDTKLKFANRKIQIDLTKTINDLEIKRDEDIQSINEDISKSETDVRKEIFKAQQTASKEIYNITDKYATSMRTQTDKYKAEAKSNADKYNSNFMLLAGKGVNLKSIPSLIGADGRIETNKLTNAMFAKKGSGTGGGFTPTQLLKLQAGGINPKDRKAAADYLYGKNASNNSGSLGKPTYAGEELVLGTGKDSIKIASELEVAGASSADIVQIQDLLNKGHSLKSIAKSTGMPATTYNAFNKYITKGEQ
jgi:hypothetical protein